VRPLEDPWAAPYKGGLFIVGSSPRHAEGSERYTLVVIVSFHMPPPASCGPPGRVSPSLRRRWRGSRKRLLARLARGVGSPPGLGKPRRGGAQQKIQPDTMNTNAAFWNLPQIKGPVSSFVALWPGGRLSFAARCRTLRHCPDPASRTARSGRGLLNDSPTSPNVVSFSRWWRGDAAPAGSPEGRDRGAEPPPCRRGLSHPVPAPGRPGRADRTRFLPRPRDRWRG
jgi:hypothetical protein